MFQLPDMVNSFIQIFWIIYEFSLQQNVTTLRSMFKVLSITHRSIPQLYFL